MGSYQMYGAFQDDGRAYKITERKTPRHWYNYFYNDTYNAFASQVGFGEGFAQDDLGNRVLMVRDRMLYIVDAESRGWFSANGLPISRSYDEYHCLHGLGYTTLHSRCMDIETDETLFVPLNGNCELWTATITNCRPAPARLRLIAYCATNIDSAYRPQAYNTDMADFDRNSQAVTARGFATFESAESKAVYEYLMCDAPVSGYDTAHNAFIGVYGNSSAPEALEAQAGCRDSACVGEKICLALQTDCLLQPGERKTVHFLIGLADTPRPPEALRALLAAGAPERALAAVRKAREDEIGGAVIETPDDLMNKAFNGFYQYATAMGSRWARVRHNGYRDLMSDCECLSSFNPELAWRRYCRALRYQYANGYAPRTFIDGAIRDNNFADCAVWITFTGYAIVMELGDLSLLREPAPFNDGSKASVYEHMKRSVEFLYRFTGQHGLIKIWGGDWNDCMNEAGLQGRGESVWLSIAWCRAARMLAELADALGETEDARRAREERAAMEKLIETYGWDGEYYLTALDDEGRPIGSHLNDEGRLFLNPQLWAVLGEVGSPERRARAMASVEALETPLGTVVSAPPYTRLDHRIGSVTMKAPGMHENGGVYLHAMCWKLAVDAILHSADKVQKDIAQILPWDQTYAPTVGEPYILFNSYFGKQTGYRYATPGQSWRTASTAWFVKAMLLYVFGLQPSLDGLSIRPCLPPAWRECTVVKRFRGCVYRIRYHQRTPGGRLVSVTVGGQPVSSPLPIAKGENVDVDVLIE
ncbi:MAG: hypothetical protein J5602_13900 [Clostridia bacterium]|nr:hypothetical protein [Clostridia bacterium]